MPKFMLVHRHEPAECGVAFAAWKAFDSPLRRALTVASCRLGGHCLWWTVDAESASDALKLLPPFVARRTEVTEVSEVLIP